MKRISAARIGILQGSQLLFSDFADGGVMWTGQGHRESRQAIRFDPLFTEPPAVVLTISMWDTDHAHNARVDLTAEKITTKGFDLVFRTWADTRVARIRADWTAIGAVRDEEDWDVV
jgi:hypothetical protein